MQAGDNTPYQINIEGLMQENLTHQEFLASELDFDGTFDTYDECKSWMLSLARTRDSLTFEYFFQSLNSYRSSKILNSLMNKGIIESFYNEEGDEMFRLTEAGKIAAKNGSM